MWTTGTGLIMCFLTGNRDTGTTSSSLLTRVSIGLVVNTAVSGPVWFYKHYYICYLGYLGYIKIRFILTIQRINPYLDMYIVLP